MSNLTFQRQEVRDLDPFYLQEVRWAFHLLRAKPPKRTKEELEAMWKEPNMQAAKQAGLTVSTLLEEMASYHTRFCHQNTQSFLAWHRRYVGLFEEVLRNTYVEDFRTNPPNNVPSGWNPEELALPFWNYTAVNIADALTLPGIFADQGPVPTGRGAPVPNPLFHATRDWEVNLVRDLTIPEGGGLSRLEAETAHAFRWSVFGPTLSSGGQNQGFQSVLEITPHGTVHDDVGGHMAFVPLAAFDPVFWFHHCNIDRLWHVWTLLHPGQGPSQQQVDGWLARQDLHYAGLLDQPNAPFVKNPNARAAALRSEATVGTAGVEYSSQRHHARVQLPGLLSGGDRFMLKVPHLAQIAGPYTLHFVALAPEQDLPTSASEVVEGGAYASQRLAVLSTFTREKCNCTPEELSIKVDPDFTYDVTERVLSIFKGYRALQHWTGGNLPNGYRVAIIPVKSTLPTSAGSGSGAGGGAGAGGHACRHHDVITSIRLKQGVVASFPYVTTFEVIRERDQVVRQGLYAHFLPLQPTGDDDAGREEAKGDEGSIKGKVRFVSDKPVAHAAASLASVEEWSPNKLRDLFGTGGKGLRIGIVDTGIDLSHDDLNNLAAASVDPTDTRLHWRDFSTDASSVPCDYLGHGTLTATILAGDVDGLVPDATLFMAKAFAQSRSANWDTIAKAIHWLIKCSVHVIVLPLGAYADHRGAVPGTARRVYQAISDGIVVVAASGLDVSHDRELTSAAGTSNSSKGVMFPASLPGVVSVAAAREASLCTKDTPTHVGKPEELLLGFKRGQRTSDVDLVAPGVASVGLAGDRRIAAGSSLAAAYATAVISLSLAAANGPHLAFGDRDIRSVVGTYEWLKSTGYASPHFLPRKLLSPVRVYNRLVKSGKLAAKTDADVAQLTTLFARMNVPLTSSAGVAYASGVSSALEMDVHKYALAAKPPAPSTERSWSPKAVSLMGMVRLLPITGTSTDEVLRRVFATVSAGEPLTAKVLAECVNLPTSAEKAVYRSRVETALSRFNAMFGSATPTGFTVTTDAVKFSGALGARTVAETVMRVTRHRPMDL